MEAAKGYSFDENSKCDRNARFVAKHQNIVQLAHAPFHHSAFMY
jgi:hypothetical protein